MPIARARLKKASRMLGVGDCAAAAMLTNSSVPVV
jgi:hypothetical protein